MNGCDDMRLRLAAYADDELAVEAAIEVERHLRQCGACRREVGRQRHLTRALRELYPSPEVPPGFEGRVRWAVLARNRVRPTARVRALAIVAAFAAAGLGWWGASHLRDPGATGTVRVAADPAPSRDDAPGVAAAAALHRDADAGDLALEVASRDVGEVNRWLARRLPFAGTIGVPGSSAITVEGATTVTLGDRPAGLVRYRMHGRAVSLFLLAAPVWDGARAPVRVGGVDFRVFQRRGLELVGWSHAPLSYLLVSEDGTRGEACAACHAGNDRSAIAEFAAAVAGRATEM